MTLDAQPEKSPITTSAESQTPFVSKVRPMGGVSEAEAKPAALPTVQRFTFKSQRKAHGYVALFSAFGFGFVTTVLLSQAGHSLEATHHMFLFGTLGLIAMIGFATVAYRDFRGGLVVDQNGIRSLPQLFGFQIDWNELKKYEWKSAAIKGLDGNQLWLWKSGSSPIVFEAGWISPRDRQSLQEWLQRKGTLSA